MAKKKKASNKAAKQPVKKFITCNDCGDKYEQGTPHVAFCSARTCPDCGTTYDYILNGDICDECCSEVLFEYEDLELEDDQEV